MNTEQTVPEGYMRNHVGHLVPMESIKEIDILEDKFVREIISRVKAFSGQMELFKRQLAEDIQAFVDLAAEDYGVAPGKVSGRWIPLRTYDRQYSIVKEVSDVIDFDARLQIAKQLIDECLDEWGQNSDPKIKTMLFDAFQVNKKGRINVQKVLGLRKFKIKDRRWEKAMDAISDSLTVIDSKPYYRMHERDKDGRYQQITLDFSRI